MKELKTIILTLSLVVNAAGAAFVLYALSGKGGGSVTYESPAEEGEYVTAAAVVSVPADGWIDFGPITLSLDVGEMAIIQYSVMSAGKPQGNWKLSPLYDHEVVSVESGVFGLRVKALASGEASLQTITEQGMKTIANVTVEKDE